jgi:hypothetical protein
MAAWLRRGLFGLASQLLSASDSFTRDHFDDQVVRALYAEHLRGADRTAELWPLIVLELWHAGERARRRERLPEVRDAAS